MTGRRATRRREALRRRAPARVRNCAEAQPLGSRPCTRSDDLPRSLGRRDIFISHRDRGPDSDRGPWAATPAVPRELGVRLDVGGRARGLTVAAHRRPRSPRHSRSGFGSSSWTSRPLRSRPRVAPLSIVKPSRRGRRADPLHLSSAMEDALPDRGRVTVCATDVGSPPGRGRGDARFGDPRHVGRTMGDSSGDPDAPGGRGAGGSRLGTGGRVRRRVLHVARR